MWFCTSHRASYVHSGIILTRVGTFPAIVSLYVGTHTFLGTFIVLSTFLKTYKQYTNVKEIIYIYNYMLDCEWVSDCWLTPTHQYFSYIMARTNYFSMRWRWGPLCTRPTRLVYRGDQLYLWRNRGTRRKPPTCHKSLTKFIT